MFPFSLAPSSFRSSQSVGIPFSGIGSTAGPPVEPVDYVAPGPFPQYSRHDRAQLSHQITNYRVPRHLALKLPPTLMERLTSIGYMEPTFTYVNPAQGNIEYGVAAIARSVSDLNAYFRSEAMARTWGSKKDAAELADSWTFSGFAQRGLIETLGETRDVFPFYYAGIIEPVSNIWATCGLRVRPNDGLYLVLVRMLRDPLCSTIETVITGKVKGMPGRKPLPRHPADDPAVKQHYANGAAPTEADIAAFHRQDQSVSKLTPAVPVVLDDEQYELYRRQVEEDSKPSAKPLDPNEVEHIERYPRDEHMKDNEALRTIVRFNARRTVDDKHCWQWIPYVVQGSRSPPPLEAYTGDDWRGAYVFIGMVHALYGDHGSAPDHFTATAYKALHGAAAGAAPGIASNIDGTGMAPLYRRELNQLPGLAILSFPRKLF